MTLDNNLLKKIENFKRHVLKSIPLPSTNTPSSDNTNGSTGSSLEYARSDHQHPKSTLYAESVHSHNDILSDLLDDINNTTIVVDSPNPIGQDGDTILLRGRMYGDDVSGKSIDYYIGNTLIGSSVTNSNGVSFLDYECDGLGVRNVTAKNGSIVSEIYEVLDATFYDRYDKANTNYSLVENWTDTTLAVVDDYKLAFKDNVTEVTARIIVPNVIQGDFIAELEIKTEDYFVIGLRDGIQSSSVNSNWICYGYQPTYPFADWKYVRITRTDSTIIAEVSSDNVNWETMTATTNDIGSADCYFQIAFGYSGRPSKKVYFRNLKIYPI